MSHNALDKTGVTVSYSTEDANFPGSNITDDLRTKVWRTTGITSEYIQFESSNYIEAASVCIANTNLSGAADIIVRGDDDPLNLVDSPPTAPAFEQTFKAYETIFGFGEGGFGEHGFGGTLLPEELPLYVTIVRFFTNQFYKSWRIKFVDSTNSDPYLEFGKIFLGPYFEPVVGFAWKWNMVYVDPSRTDYSLGGQAYTDILTPYNICNINFNALTEWEVLYNFRRLAQEFGTHKDLFITLLPDTAKHRIFTSLYGRFPQSELKFPNPSNGRYTGYIQFRESV
jgi:hypothetical protein